jgi:leucyl/phenylalanyl-tRNA--protein transferase
MNTPEVTEEIIPCEVLLEAYAQGVFPMCHDDGMLYWHDPDPRAVFRIGLIRPNARLRRYLARSGFVLTEDHAFEAVVRACADRGSSWIDERIIRSYVALHRAGHAHSVETWKDGRLVGGIYGVALGAAFFGESLFTREANAGKAAFHHLAERLEHKGYRLFDSQYINDFTRQLGAVEISAGSFKRSLHIALREQPETPASWSERS